MAGESERHVGGASASASAGLPEPGALRSTLGDKARFPGLARGAAAEGPRRGRQALFGECPPAAARGRHLLLDFAEKTSRPLRGMASEAWAAGRCGRAGYGFGRRGFVAGGLISVRSAAQARVYLLPLDRCPSLGANWLRLSAQVMLPRASWWCRHKKARLAAGFFCQAGSAGSAPAAIT